MGFYPASEHILYFLKRGSFKQKKSFYWFHWSFRAHGFKSPTEKVAIVKFSLLQGDILNCLFLHVEIASFRSVSKRRTEHLKSDETGHFPWKSHSTLVIDKVEYCLDAEYLRRCIYFRIFITYILSYWLK